MLSNQKHLFNLTEDSIFLNAAYMSPQLLSVSEIGLKHVIRKERPDQFSKADFFDPRKKLKEVFARLIDAEDDRSIAIIPSVSYGVASVAQNIPLKQGEEILVVEGQFPSHIYAWQQLADRNGGKVRVVQAPVLEKGRGLRWNEALLAAINDQTAVVAVPHVHWADGTIYDLQQIGERAHAVGAKLIVDGTQSVGALPLSVRELGVDALICAGYKWLMGPYGIGVAYFSESFWDGTPIEHNWLNRYNSEDFTNLTHYQDAFQPGAERFSVGESSNFVYLPMLARAIEQVLEWKPAAIQAYCGQLIASGVDKLRASGYFIEDDAYRSNHLFGVYVKEEHDLEAIKHKVEQHNIKVSYRGEAIRISPHVYNDRADFERFVECLI